MDNKKEYCGQFIKRLRELNEKAVQLQDYIPGQDMKEVLSTEEKKGLGGIKRKLKEECLEFLSLREKLEIFGYIIKFKDLGLLPQRHLGGAYSGMDYLNIFSWDDWVLERINGDRLLLSVRKGRKGANQKSEITLIRNIYNQLNDKEKNGLKGFFKENIGKTIGQILEITINFRQSI